MTEEKEKKIVNKEVLVVAQLPQQAVREAVMEDGKEYSILTIEEALAEILNSVRHIEKSVA